MPAPEFDDVDGSGVMPEVEVLAPGDGSVVVGVGGSVMAVEGSVGVPAAELVLPVPLGLIGSMLAEPVLVDSTGTVMAVVGSTGAAVSPVDALGEGLPDGADVEPAVGTSVATGGAVVADMLVAGALASAVETDVVGWSVAWSPVLGDVVIGVSLDDDGSLGTDVS